MVTGVTGVDELKNADDAQRICHKKRMRELSLAETN
jgi:hypothetical protein